MKMLVNILCALLLACASASCWAEASQLGSPHMGVAFNGYLAASNLNAYIASLKSIPHKTGDYYYALAKASFECAIFGIDRAHAIHATRGLKSYSSTAPYDKIRISMLQRLNQRCAGFRVAHSNQVGTATALLKQAEFYGNVPAEALLLALNDAPQGTAAATRNEAIRIIDTQNPEAIYELSSLFGDGTLELKIPILINHTEAEYAWQIVACKLGLDCSHSSALVQQACLTGGPCGNGNYVENIEIGKVSPDQFRKINRAVMYILRVVRSSNARTIIVMNQHVSSTDIVRPLLGPPRTREPPSHEDEPEIDLSDPRYSYIHSDGVYATSDYSVRVGVDTAAEYAYDFGHPELRMAQTFKIKYRDGSEETAVVTVPRDVGSSVGAVPIPGSQVGANGIGSAPGGVVILPIGGSSGSQKQWACVGVGSGDNEVWTCTYE